MPSISYFTGNTDYFPQTKFDYLTTVDFFDQSFSHFDHDIQDSISNLVSSFVPLTSNLSCDTGLLPPGVRYIGKNYVVFERPPCYQNIFYIPSRVEDMTEYSYDDDGEIEETTELDLEHSVYRLPVPWQLYIATFSDEYICSNVYMYFMKTSLFSSDQKVYIPTLPNFYSNGLLCRPMFSSMDEILAYEKNIKGVIESSYNWIWGGGTNNDLNENTLQLFAQIESHPIISKVSEDYRHHFPAYNNHHASHYANPATVSRFLAAWESCTLEEIVSSDCHWPNPSETLHFVSGSSNSSEVYPHDFLDNLPTYLNLHFDAFTDESFLSDEDIEDIISNEDYSFDDYRSWMINTGRYTPPPPLPPWHKEFSYMDVLNNSLKTLNYNNSSVKAKIDSDISNIENFFNNKS